MFSILPRTLMAFAATVLIYNTYKIWFIPAVSEEDMVNDMVEYFTKGLIKDYPVGSTKRDGHPKPVGIVRGEFTVLPTILPEHRIGVFSEPGKTYPCYVRVSNGGFGKAKPDFAPGIKGFAIKLLDETNKSKSLGQDFMVISAERTGLGSAEAIHSGLIGNPIMFVLDMILTGNVMDLILQFSNYYYHVFDSALEIPFWSNTPYAFGHHNIVKYHVTPTSTGYKAPKVDPKKEKDENYLEKVMKDHLSKAEATFDFFVQFRASHAQSTDTLKVWSKTDSPWIHLATVRIPKQEFAQNEELGEELSFSPGHAWPEHEPVGKINRVRLGVYLKMQKFRHERDGRKDFV